MSRSDRKMVQVSSEAHAAIKAISERTGESMYRIASRALSEECGDDLAHVGTLLRKLEADGSEEARVDVLAYVLAHHV